MLRRMAPVGLLILGVASSSVVAKGRTELIVIQGPSLAELIVISDPRVSHFDVWSGPGANGAYTRCLPLTLECPGARTVPAYTVFYAFNAASARGFVYIPGPDDSPYAAHSTSIYRGPRVEGLTPLAINSPPLRG